jgi:penicillin-insensitive murein endopeptidase
LARVELVWWVRFTVPLLRPHLAAASVLFVATAATAAPPPPTNHTHVGRGNLKMAKLEAPPQRAAPGLSVGSPTEGHLVGGAHLTETPYLRIVPAYAGGDARWGIEPLVSMIDHAARTVRKQFPDAVLSVGHLSRPGGGEIDRHASHESGRDADIGYYVKNHVGKPIYADHFVPFKGDGTAKSWPGAEFDDARNWSLVATIASDAHAHVTHIFVAFPIRARLLQYAEKIGAPPAVRTRAAELMAQPKGALPHDDHFHVRIGCPSGMDKCIEQPLARKHGHGALARASGAHSGKDRSGSHAQDHVAASHARTAPGPKASERDEPPARGERAEKGEETVVPSLAPIVPGLDSAVIPAPLWGRTSAPRSVGDDATALPPGAQPIDDPDGVLDRP